MAPAERPGDEGLATRAPLAHGAVVESPVSSSPPSSESRRVPRSAIRRLRWVVGVAALIAVVVLGVHLAEAREFIHIAENAEPAWLAAVVLLQAGTYATAGQIFRRVARAGGHSLSLATACRLGLTKLVVDHALPSAGLSGTFALASGLERRGIPRDVVAASVTVNLASHYAAHVSSLALALAASAAYGETHDVILLAALVFLLLSVGLTASLLALSGRRDSVVPRPLARIRPLRATIEFVQRADPRLARSPRLIGEASAYQLAIILLDATTMWILIRSLGADPPIGPVFASFTLSNIVRLITGLGGFEAASLLTLRLVGVSTAVALAATLLFRGFRFWLPLVPGLWLSRRLLPAVRRSAA